MNLPPPNSLPDWRRSAPAGVPLARVIPPGSLAQKSQGVPAFWFARAIEVNSQESLFEPYRNSVWVQRAIKTIAGPCASVEMEFYPIHSARKTGGRRKTIYGRHGRVTRDVTEEIDLPALRDWMREPMKGHNWSDFVEATIGWMKLQECFWLLGDDLLVPFPEARQAAPAPIIIARPDRMRHIVENNQLVGWQFTDDGGKSYNLLPEQVIQIGYFNPYNKWRRLGEYEAALIATEADWFAGKFSRNLMSNNGDTGPYIVAKNGVPTDPQREQILMDLRAKRQAQLRGDFRPIFMTGDIEVQDPTIKSVDAAFVTQRLENRHEIALAFGVPPSMFDVKAAYSIGSASDFFALILNTCIPAGVKFCGAFDALIEKITGQKIESCLDWDEHPVMQSVRNERFDSMEKLCNRGMPMKTASEYLSLDIPEFPGWEVGTLPFSVTPVGNVETDLAPDNLDYSEEPEPTEDELVQDMMHALRHGCCKHGAAPAPQRRTANAQLWQKHMRLRAKAVKLYASKASKVFNEFRATALKNYFAVQGKAINQRSLIDLIFDEHAFGRAIVANINPVHRSVLQTAGEELFGEIGKDDPWTMPPQKALEFLNARSGPLADIAATARGQLNTALQNALEQGLSTDETANAIRGVFNDLSKGEARRIAMTETSAAYGFARHEAMTDAGIEYKSWLSSHGPNVRPAHAAAEEFYGDNPIPVDEPFLVGGEQLMYPGDPSGSPGNIINCQCVQLAAQKPQENPA